MQDAAVDSEPLRSTKGHQDQF
ncbi:MAG: hypothetical protein RIR27_559, partial [Pseudomonadota bacterium]